MSKRYFYANGYGSEVTGTVTMSGPQSEDQVPEMVRTIFEKGYHKITGVMIEYQDQNKDARFDLYRLIEVPKP